MEKGGITTTPADCFTVKYSDDECALGADLVPRFSHFGFALIEDVFSVEDIAEMQAEMACIVDAIDVESAPKVVFNASDEKKVVLYLHYFLHCILTC